MFKDYKRYAIDASQWKNIFDLEDGSIWNLFVLHSKNQNKFKIELNKFQLEIVGKELPDSIDKIMKEFDNLAKLYPRLYNSNKRRERGRLDFDIAEIYHRNLSFPKRSQNDYGLWRYLTLNFFIEHAHWRWRSDNEKEPRKTAEGIYNHSIATKYPKRINALRYWIIGERLYDDKNKYKLLQTIAKRSREHKSGAYQDYINNIIDNKMLSPHDFVSKELGRIMFDRERPFVTKDVVGSFKRFNAYKLRDYRYTTDTVLEKEICLIK